MAEALCRQFRGDLIEAYSCGIEKHGLNALAVQVMAEIGIDISAHNSKTLVDLGDSDFDYVVTVCSHADSNCPVFPGETTTIHRGFDDPPALAAAAKNIEEALPYYRRVRDEIKDYVMTFPEALVAQR